MPVYTEQWARLAAGITAALPPGEAHLVDELNTHFREILRERNEVIQRLRTELDKLRNEED